MTTHNSPYLLKPASVQSVMLRVLLALLPGIAACVYFFGGGVLVQIALASLTALVAEAIMLSIRRKPLALFLSDGSALVTAWLLALTLPPIAPWWLVVTATALAIVVAKHLYGGLGQNPFNPAMVGFCLMIVAFPQLMSQWPGVHAADFATQLQLIFGTGMGTERVLDAITSATPLDAVRTALHSGTASLEDILHGKGFGYLSGAGAEWVAASYLLGGLFLLQQRLITWHLPTAFITTLALCAGLAHFANPHEYAGPLFHLFSGGAMLGAFFIITDPVSGCTTPRGKLYFALGAGLLTWVIRSFGAYPDGVAFSVLLMNIVAPLLDRYNQPPVFGHKK